MAQQSLFPLVRSRRVLVLLVACLVCPGVSKLRAHEGWLTDMDQAMETAKKDGKDILIDFSGSDWCHWCQVLDKEVFSKEEFDAAKEKFVLVSLDFPNESDQTEAEKKHNEQWREKLQVEGFPAVFLLDDSARPYARTGYQEGGVEKYLEHLDTLLAIREKRDAALALADSSKGVDRAKHLDQAMLTMEPDLVWLAYEPMIREIMTLDGSGEAGLKAKYEEGLQRRLIGKELQVIMDEFDPTRPDATVKRLRGLEEKYSPKGKVREDLRGVMAQALMRAGNTEQAMALADEMLEEASLAAESRVNWTVLKVNILASSRDFDGALKLLDSLTSDASVPDELAVGLTVLKVEIHLAARQSKQALALLDSTIKAMPESPIRAQLKQMRDGVQARVDAAAKAAADQAKANAAAEAARKEAASESGDAEASEQKPVEIPAP